MIFAADRWREILIMNQLDKLTPGNFRQGFEKRFHFSGGNFAPDNGMAEIRNC